MQAFCHDNYIFKLDFQDKNLNLDRDLTKDLQIFSLALLTTELSKFQVQIFLLKIWFVNSTRHEIYRLNLNVSYI